MSFGLVIGLILLCAGSVAAQPRYVTTPLGEFQPTDVSNAGDVLGRGAGSPAVWRAGAVVPLQHLGRGGTPVRWSDGHTGLAVGAVGNPSSPTGGFLAAQWDLSGALTLLYTQHSAHGSLATARNAQGQVSGHGGRMDATQGVPLSSAMRWDTPASVAVMNTQDGQWSESVGIDGQGHVWGLDEQNQTVVWTPTGEKLVIPGNPGRWPVLSAVNRHGLAVGQVTRLDDASATLPVRVTLQGFTPMPTEAGASCQPRDVNRLGDSVGNCWVTATNSNVPVLWQANRMLPLALDVPPEVQHLTLVAMNDPGALVGFGVVTEAQPSGPPITRTRGFLFIPDAPLMARLCLWAPTLGFCR